MVSQSFEDLFSYEYGRITAEEIRERIIGNVRRSMKNVFGDVILGGLRSPLQDGSFFFGKGISRNFHYKNLSGGEKSAFDLILDIVMKKQAYNDTVYCIDEPDLHMHTRLQGLLLEEMLQLLPTNCQLWMATHAIGMMKRAKEIHEANHDEVAFLDFHDCDFDKPQVIEPCKVTRKFWMRTLNVALDDLAGLVAPKVVVLCEGRPSDGKRRGKNSEFDAKCYRAIFENDFPDVDFVSVGNEDNVQEETLRIGKAIQTLTSGTKVLRLRDRDDCSEAEVQQLRGQGIRVLTWRNLESYLLHDDVLSALCASEGKTDQLEVLLAAKAQAVRESRERQHRSDDLKPAGGQICDEAKRILGMAQGGSTKEVFYVERLAPLLKPGMQAYEQLKQDVFGS